MYKLCIFVCIFLITVAAANIEKYKPIGRYHMSTTRRSTFARHTSAAPVTTVKDSDEDLDFSDGSDDSDGSNDSDEDDDSGDKDDDNGDKNKDKDKDKGNSIETLDDDDAAADNEADSDEDDYTTTEGRRWWQLFNLEIKEENRESIAKEKLQKAHEATVSNKDKYLKGKSIHDDSHMMISKRKTPLGIYVRTIYHTTGTPVATARTTVSTTPSTVTTPDYASFENDSVEFANASTTSTTTERKCTWDFFKLSSNLIDAEKITSKSKRSNMMVNTVNINLDEDSITKKAKTNNIEIVSRNFFMEAYHRLIDTRTVETSASKVLEEFRRATNNTLMI